jgi:hypothetical protein
VQIALFCDLHGHSRKLDVFGERERGPREGVMSAARRGFSHSVRIPGGKESKRAWLLPSGGVLYPPCPAAYGCEKKLPRDGVPAYPGWPVPGSVGGAPNVPTRCGHAYGSPRYRTCLNPYQAL